MDYNIGDYVEPITDSNFSEETTYEDMHGFVVGFLDDLVCIESIGRENICTWGKADNFRKGEIPEIFKDIKRAR